MVKWEIWGQGRRNRPESKRTQWCKVGEKDLRTVGNQRAQAPDRALEKEARLRSGREQATEPRGEGQGGATEQGRHRRYPPAHSHVRSASPQN
ncbi:hypothetical protein E5288_WYG008546 [Bos mutus]|uniref:Uncharacterized protein n=1 Tax=Bos mutus TaxID=72004 RepID=A0A6B0RVC8_9CETA|nr:hypothetical protein [Bos mutus]